jgi:hypothetical protein
MGSIMYLNESESNCEYLNESESNCEYRRKIVNPQILQKINQCLSADPFEVFFCKSKFLGSTSSLSSPAKEKYISNATKGRKEGMGA